MEPQLKVMVLDTSQVSRKILELILRREGHQVVSYADPVEALRFLLQHGPADLLFLGLDLPKMDGFDVLKYLKGQPRFRSMGTIALLSMHNGILDRIKARLAGAQQVLNKPLVQQQVVALVSEYCRRSAPAQEPARSTEIPGQEARERRFPCREAER